MAMHNPPHHGEFIQATYMEPFNLSCRYLAEQLDVAASTLNRVIKKRIGRLLFRLLMFLMMATTLMFTVIGSQFTVFSINDATSEALGY